MTSRRLPETDIANICTLPENEQRFRLSAKRSFVPPYSLEHTRRNLSSLFGVKSPLCPDVEVDDRKTVEALMRCCKKESEALANANRASAIIDFRDANVGKSVVGAMRSHRVTLDNSICLTHSLALEIGGKGYIPFLDLRKTGNLSSRARDFVFSMNYHLLIDSDPTYENFGLLVLNYWEKSSSENGLTPYFFDGNPKYSYDDLSNMIARTYEIWLDILAERKRQEPGKDTMGPLFG
ncbi:hypothetical protein [Algirhabdus cladophorae]|uniref:hypothetical protein n=1 Tax=Algirhabdus cladophorae TaxID=3377108 RepID=UPI003B845930